MFTSPQHPYKFSLSVKMKFVLIFLMIIQVNLYIFNNHANQDQCEDLFSLNVYETDVSKVISGTNEEKKQIAGLFDQAFHHYGVIRLIKTNLTSDIIDKIKEFFALEKETKRKYYFNGYIMNLLDTNDQD